MSREPLYITGFGCLTPFGHTIDNLTKGLTEKKSAIQTTPLPQKCRSTSAPLGLIPDFKELLVSCVRPNMRRKMSRLSRMSTLAAGLALKSAGLVDENGDTTGITFGTAFGSTGRSEIFFLDSLEHGPMMVNPGLFPETVPNAPAGQISIRYRLKGPNATICQQNLSAELALLHAKEMLESGMAEKMLVISAEELSLSLLKGFDALGILKTEKEFSSEGVKLSPRTLPGEAAIALVLETAESARQRNAKKLSILVDVEVRGCGVWPPKYSSLTSDSEVVLNKLLDRNSPAIDSVVCGGTFIKSVDQGHFGFLEKLNDGGMSFMVPEYSIGNLMGAGLIKVLTGTLLLQDNLLPMRSLNKKVPDDIILDSFYDQSSSSINQVLTSAVSAGGGAGMVLLSK